MITEDFLTLNFHLLSLTQFVSFVVNKKKTKKIIPLEIFIKKINSKKIAN